MKLKKYESMIMAVLFIIISFVYASQIPFIKITKFTLVNSAFFPKVLCVLLLSLSGIQLLFGINDIKNWKEDANKEEAVQGTDWKCVAETFALSVFYVAALKPAGFLISTVIYLFLQICVLCPKENLKPFQFGAVALIASMIIYFIFRNGLGLMLPQGILKGFL